MTAKAQRRLHERACKLLGIDPGKAPLLTSGEFRAVTGEGLNRNYGKADWEHNVIVTKRTASYDTYVHELLHLLFPSRPHWWIFTAAFKLSGMVRGKRSTAVGWYKYGRGMFASDCKESRATLLRLAYRSAERKGLA